MGNRPWTAEEEAYLISHAAEIERVARVLKRTVIAVRTKATHLHILGSVVGNSISSLHRYRGPVGWTIEQGAPCAMCRFHRRKILQSGTKGAKVTALRRECRYCEARIAWADHTGGHPQSAEYAEVWWPTFRHGEVG